MSTLFVAFLRQRFTSIGRVLLLFLGFAFPLAMVGATRGGLGLQPLGTATLFTFVLGAGMIGGDSSSGVFQLLFARPVTRTSYLISRWLAVAAAASALNALQVGLGGLILAGNGALDGWQTPARFALEQSAGAFGLAAVIACFSSVLPGFGDVFALVAAQVTVSILRGAATFAKQPWLGPTLDEVQRTLSPELSWTAMTGTGRITWLPLVTLVSTIALALALAALALYRREISYASD